MGHSLIIPPRLQALTEMRDRQGHMSAFVPRGLLLWPIWNHPKTASCTPEQSRTWYVRDEHGNSVKHNVSQVNVLPKAGPEDSSSASPHGLLRWIDLDVSMALSHGALLQGRTNVEIAQADALRWMGHDQLLQAPYDTLHASLGRLSYVRIAHWLGNDKPRAGSEQLDEGQILTMFKLVQGRVGNGKDIQAELSPWWVDSLRNGRWQEVDLDAYAHLVRSYRKDGLARVLYCYLAAHRNKDLTSAEVRWEELDWALSPRKPDGRGRRYRYLTHPRHPLPLALGVLARAGLVEPIDREDRDWCRVRLITRGIPTIASQGVQNTYLPASIMTPWARIETSKASSPATAPAAEVTAPAAALSPDSPPLPTTDATFQPFNLLRRKFPSIAIMRYQHARQRGFDDRSMAHVLLAALFGARQGTIRKPGGWVMARFLEDDPSAWSKEAMVNQIDIAAAKAWAYGPDGPLHATQKETAETTQP